MIPLNNKLFMIPAPNKGNFPYCYCLYIRDDVHGLIDSSCGKQQAQALLSEEIDVVINSHFHGDHTRLNWMFERSQIWAHYIDAPAIRSRENWVNLFGFLDLEDYILANEFRRNLNVTPSPVHRELNDNDRLDFGTVKIRVIHAPGHTRGHCVFFEENEELLFTSDITLNKYGPWYAHGDSNIEETINSIKLCRDLKPRQVISGHLGIIRGNLEKHFNDYLNIVYIKEEVIYKALATPQTLEQLFEMRLFAALPSYEGVKSRLLDFYDKVIINKHLERLQHMNMVGKANDLYYQL